VWATPVTRVDYGKSPPGVVADTAVALAGPAASLMLWQLLIRVPGEACWAAAMTSLTVGVAALAPLPWCDGHRVLANAIRGCARGSDG
jgi:hypothetical protein